MAIEMSLVDFTDQLGRAVTEDFDALLRPHAWPESARAVLRVASATGVDDRLIGISHYVPEQVPVEAIRGHTSWSQAREMAWRLNLIGGRRGRMFIIRSEEFSGFEVRVLESRARVVATPYLAADGTVYSYHVRWRGLAEKVMS